MTPTNPPDPDPRPREPFVWSSVPRSPTEFRSPAALVAWGIVCILGGPVFGGVLIAVAPVPRPPIAYVIAVGFAVVVLLLGVWSIHVGRRRARWRRELAAWLARHPGSR